MLKRNIKVAGFLTLVALLLTGCSGNNSGSEATPAPSQSSSSSQSEQQSSQSVTSTSSSSESQSSQSEKQNQASSSSLKEIDKQIYNLILQDMKNRHIAQSNYTIDDYIYQPSAGSNEITTYQVLENHQSANMKAIGADPNTAPVVGKYQMRANGHLYYYDPIENQNIDTGYVAG
ncbi:hypothetical protein [Holzapfeliella floricola]|uniref:Lipoprotein n=1 Tax=Holzapfeliella floricola DSM 23037 = JCM 16512 TaxID=1423744 RepID=A0A0R2DRA5_9LACO|nr:hypothetical protein [Holzapfeliella floricola]KRN04341.1 hypothetical protein FC86_GL000439 [Holzapfeliella floricola DSM 23037 = JCM 16512]